MQPLTQTIYAMTPIPFVKQDQLDYAREMERKLLALSPSSGILFVGVEVTPTRPDEQPTYKISVGLDRSLGLESVIEHLIYQTLSDEIIDGADLRIEVRRGVIRA